ncbi:hypothetical protein GCM10020358_73440 [Amorphoplanes nipponensis]|uniref:Uncharacterized protein n=1 Tax=Actinoplanes nipponensis TaxID=135950 RepID=A0A919MU49_9ACTN|nr:hypothetical protein [Actinoplanes nipponensis]GIE49760.1 hypothetical protein Ani05nite_32940 [Actinoplanes nipponensis]
MSGAEFSGVDIDLLADYVGGALDGTPDEATVAALIADDPAWRDAHDLLSGGVTAVTGHLRALGEAAEPMPADVIARLDAALLTAADHGAHPVEAAAPGSSVPDDVPGGVTAGPGAMEPGSDGAAPDRHLVAVPSGSSGRRARRLRWTAPIGIAAGVLAFAGFGLQQQFAGGSSEDTASSAGSAAEPPAAAQELALPNGAAQILQSGTDYRRETLAAPGNSTMLAPAPAQDPESPSRKLGGGAAAVEPDPALDRLREQAALRACIEAIAAQYGAGDITAQTIDLARYDGAPAVIVRFVAAGDATWVWASGPACGTPGVGADKLAAVRVG